MTYPNTSAELIRKVQGLMERDLDQIEDIGLLADGIAALIVMSGYPPLDSIYPDAAKLARVKELKAKLFPANGASARKG